MWVARARGDLSESGLEGAFDDLYDTCDDQLQRDYYQALHLVPGGLAQELAELAESSSG